MWPKITEIDYAAITRATVDAATKTAEVAKKTAVIADAVTTIRGDYLQLREDVRPLLSSLPNDVQARLTEIDEHIVNLYRAAEGVTEQHQGRELVVSAYDAARLIKPAREGIAELIALGDQHRDDIDIRVAAQIDALAGKWATIDDLIIDVEETASRSIRVQKIKRILSVLAELLPLAKIIIDEVRK